MKKRIALIGFCFLVPLFANSQDSILGKWQGTTLISIKHKSKQFEVPVQFTVLFEKEYLIIKVTRALDNFVLKKYKKNRFLERIRYYKSDKSPFSLTVITKDGIQYSGTGELLENNRLKLDYQEKTIILEKINQ